MDSQFPLFPAEAVLLQTAVHSGRRLVTGDAHVIFLGPTRLEEHLKRAGQHAPFTVANLLGEQDWRPFEQRYAAAGIHAQLGNPQEAYRQMVALRKTEQHLAETANSKLSSELKVRFDVELKEKENALLRAKEQESEARRLNLLLALILSFLLLGVVAFYLRRRAAMAETE